ncbi:MAG: DUF192 domain-containing protein [Dehalococcoidia bacterium]|nr:DUF192 domain-containing protein [Dehalococcoidia bacterium]
MRILNVTRGTELAREARAARGLVSRTVGLLGRSSLQPGEGLVLEPCSSVHTAFMRFPIDVVYVSRDGQVVKVCPDVKPFRLSAALRGARSVLELPTGTIRSTGTLPGDRLAFDE